MTSTHSLLSAPFPPPFDSSVISVTFRCLMVHEMGRPWYFPKSSFTIVHNIVVVLLVAHDAVILSPDYLLLLLLLLLLLPKFGDDTQYG